MLMRLKQSLMKVDNINDFSHQHLFKTKPFKKLFSIGLIMH